MRTYIAYCNWQIIKEPLREKILSCILKEGHLQSTMTIFIVSKDHQFLYKKCISVTDNLHPAILLLAWVKTWHRRNLVSMGS